jgi:hypothetical protein
MIQDEITTAVNRLGDAFASGEPDRVLSEFVSGDEVMYAGSEPDELAVGRSALRKLLAELFAREERYHWSCRHTHVVTTAQGVFAIATATLTVRAAGGDGAATEGSASESFPYRVSGLLEQSHGNWRWRACLGSEPVPPPEAVR